MRKARWFAAWAVVVAACLSTGCWDGVELQRRAVVLMMAIDPAPSGSGNVKVTLQIARPHRLQIPSAGGNSGGTSDRPIVVISREGTDVSEALHSIQLAVDRTLFFGHLKVVILQEQLARHSVLAVLNPIAQSRITRRQVWLFISHGPAGELLDQVPAMDVIPAMYLTNLFRNHIFLQRPYDATLGGFHQRLATPGIEPVVLWIERVDRTQAAPRIGGLAVLVGDRLAGYMTGVNYIGWAIIESQFPRSQLTFPCPDRPRGRFVVNITSVKTRLHVSQTAASHPRVDVDVRLQGLVEGGSCVLMEDHRHLAQLSRWVQQEVERMVAGSVRWGQALRADVFGIGREVYRHFPRDWYGDEAWCRIFPHLQVSVQAHVRLDFMETYHKSELMYQRG